MGASPPFVLTCVDQRVTGLDELPVLEPVLPVGAVVLESVVPEVLGLVIPELVSVPVPLVVDVLPGLVESVELFPIALLSELVEPVDPTALLSVEGVVPVV